MKSYLSIFAFLFFTSANCWKQYIYRNLTTTNNSISIEVNARFARKFLNAKTFNITYQDDINISNLDEETLSAPFILSVISLVWASGETYYIKTLDSNLAQSLKIIKEVYKIFYPQISWDGKLIADKITSKKKQIDNTQEMKNIISLCFSGGLDSIYSSLTLDNDKQMLITINGFSQESNEKRWPIIQQQVTSFAQTYGNRTNSFINSNFRELITGPKLEKVFPQLIPWREFCQEALSLFGVVIPLLKAQNCKKFIIPSSGDWSKPYAWGSHPFIDNNLTFQDITVDHHDFNISRLEKVNFIVDMCKQGIKKPMIHTCRHSYQSKTCTECHKSLMTINYLVANGENPQEYGYPINLNDSIKKTKQVFSQKYPFRDFDIVHVNKWDDLKKQALNLLNENILMPELKNYLSWLTSIHFKKYKIHQKYWTIDFNKHYYFLDKKWKEDFLKNQCISEI